VNFRPLSGLLRTTVLITAISGVAISSPAMAQDKTDTTKQQPSGQTPPPPPGLGPRAGAPAGAAPAEPQVETIATFNGWAVQCSDVPTQAGQPPVKACGMLRNSKSDADQSAAATLIVRRAKSADGKMHTIMEVLAPIGVWLTPGVGMEIDGTSLPGKMPFERCAPRACQAQGEAQEDTLKKFAKGRQATFYIYDRPGHSFPMKFPMQGFAEGLAALDKVIAK